ncbi:replication protein B [Lentilactobacillus farraginis DSM 18382 = JCM 14108]|uniref:Replication protein B n=1 Tax=Lentilactobacillus farraginis DSM 18382 = JCM 14108 TaxID=1423743 RepID=X0PHG1_9LACO|nr:replication protein B [Lentilactobacillus farraginis DSM 18382 = JCM 14108]
MYNKVENSNVTIHNITVVIQLSEQEKQGWTMKQIADDLGVNKMRIYRTISRLNLKEAYKKGQTLYFDQAAKDAVENAIRPNTSQSVRTNPQSRQTKTTDTSANQLLVSLNDRVKAQQTQIETLTGYLTSHNVFN